MPPSETMQCRSCGGPLSPDRFAALVACRHCGGVQAVTIGAHERPEAPRTERLTLERTPEGIRITHRWISPPDWILAVMGLIFLLPFAVMVTLAMFGSEGTVAPLGRSLRVLGTWIVAGCALFIAYGLARLARSTVFEVRERELVVRSRPSLTLSLYVKATEIQQLLTHQEVLVVGRHGGQDYHVYGLSVVLRDGQRVKLHGRMPEAGDPLFIEQQVERALGLADRPLAGEIPR
jgi:hypothetical protein